MRAEPELPLIQTLGRDLLETTAWQRYVTLARPFVLVGVYALVYALGIYWLTPIVVFLIFIAIVTSTHDVVHSALGLGRRSTEWWLFILGAILLASGHSYRMTHLRHHSVFPGPDDPEGDPARMTFWRAVLHGPAFLPLLWIWSFRRASAAQRRWLLAEAVFAVSFVACGVLLLPVTKAVLLYSGLVYSGAWVFPLLTVHLPHRNYGDSPFTQTHTMRGWVIPKLFLELTYHLEHHLYPQVPSHNLARLSKQLEPVLRAAGVVPKRAP